MTPAHLFILSGIIAGAAVITAFINIWFIVGRFDLKSPQLFESRTALMVHFALSAIGAISLLVFFGSAIWWIVQSLATSS